MCQSNRQSLIFWAGHNITLRPYLYSSHWDKNDDSGIRPVVINGVLLPPGIGHYLGRATYGLATNHRPFFPGLDFHQIYMLRKRVAKAINPCLSTSFHHVFLLHHIGMQGDGNSRLLKFLLYCMSIAQKTTIITKIHSYRVDDFDLVLYLNKYRFKQYLENWRLSWHRDISGLCLARFYTSQSQAQKMNHISELFLLFIIES